MIDLPHGLLDRYKQAFIPSHYSPFAIQTLDQNRRRSWCTESRKGVYLTDPKIEAHLRGDYYVGPVPKNFTRSIIFDLDAGENWRTLDVRTEQVCAAFPDVSPLLFSTPREGRHLHYMLSQPTFSDRATAFGKDRLASAGLVLEPGKIELFPAGSKAIRAPLGRDCFLLDNDTLDPVSQNRFENLHTLDELLETERYDRLAIPTDYRPTETPEIPQQATRQRIQRSGGEFMQEVDRLLRDGLWKPAQRNDAFLKLTWYMRVIWGLDVDNTVAELRVWIDQYHNGFSQEYNANREGVYRKVREVVERFDLGRVRKRRAYQTQETGSDDEGRISAFVNATSLGSTERDFLVCLLRYALRWGKDGSDGQIEVEVPSRTLKSFHRQYGPILRRLIEGGHMVMTRNYGADIDRCKAYTFPRFARCVPH